MPAAAPGLRTLNLSSCGLTALPASETPCCWFTSRTVLGLGSRVNGLGSGLLQRLVGLRTRNLSSCGLTALPCYWCEVDRPARAHLVQLRPGRLLAGAGTLGSAGSPQSLLFG